MNFALSLTLFTATLFTLACDFDHLPPENHTSTYMYVIKRRILRYARANDRLPVELGELPPISDFLDRTNDVWGNKIQYIVDGSTVTLISYGKDQKPGGVGDDLDVRGVFEAKSADGKWKEEAQTDYNSDWSVVPLSERK